MLLSLWGAPVSAQTVRYVDTDATGTVDGSSWADAFPDLQDALATVEAGEEVWVAEGTYRPDDTADRDASFVLVSDVGLYGGFDGTEDKRDERDPEAHVTVLSGDLGQEGDVSDNAYHVVVASGVSAATVLDGFTITGGNGDGLNPRNRGGGIYGEGSSLVVRGCRIVENRVVQTDGFGGGGGAFFGTSGTPHFEDVVFERNDGVGAIGGGLWLFGEQGAASEAEVLAEVMAEVEQSGEDRRIGERSSDTRGTVGRTRQKAALSAVLREVVFAENASKFGGGARIDDVPVVIVNATFVRNRVLDSGGGLRISGGGGHLVNVGFYGNVADPGGSISISGGMGASASTLTLTNVAFAGNTARVAGAYQQGGGENTLTHVTLAANEAEELGGIRLSSGADITVRNAISWGNTGGEIDDASGSSTLSNVLVAGGCPPPAPPFNNETECQALLDADPLFARVPSPGPDGAWGTPDDDYGDLALQEGSPAVDFGLSEFLPPDTFDLDGDGDTTEPLPLDLAGSPRVVGAEVDLGAFERPLPIANEAASDEAIPLTLAAYPNPARGPVTVTAEIRRTRRAEVAVFDGRGRRVALLHTGPLSAGRHGWRLETAGLSAGVYVVQLRGGDTARAAQVVVLR